MRSEKDSRYPLPSRRPGIERYLSGDDLVAFRAAYKRLTGHTDAAAAYPHHGSALSGAMPCSFVSGGFLPMPPVQAASAIAAASPREIAACRIVSLAEYQKARRIATLKSAP